MNTGTVLSGFLKEFGLVEILQVVELGSMTGAIHLKQNNGRVGVLYFNEGKLANASEFDPGALALGDILQQLGMATYQNIEEAYTQQLQDPMGQRIGERLIIMNVISEQQLREALRTKVLWTARELGLWQDGTYEFIASPDPNSIQKLLPYGEASHDLEVVRVTMEMVTYGDEWHEVERYLPYSMRTTLRLNDTIPYVTRFDARSLELFTHVNLYRRVRRIATALRRPEMDVSRDLSKLVQQGYLIPVQQDTMQHIHSKKVRLPEPAEKLRMENFALLDLVSRLELEWDKKHAPLEKLSTLANFINWTMDALAETCRANGVELSIDTLKKLMMNENLWYVGSYEFLVDQNHIDVEHFATFGRTIFSGDMKQAANFYDQASVVLQRLLSQIFEMINSRIADPRERMENQEVWEEMFAQFAVQRIEG